MTKMATVLVFAASSVAPAALHAPLAHADSTQEDEFFKFLDEKGVPYGRKMDAIRLAKETCLKVSRPGNPGTIGYGIHQDLHKDLGLNSDQAEYFITASIYQYCPQVWHLS